MNEPMNNGLHGAVRASAASVLRELLPVWTAEQSADWRRVVRPQGQGSFSINIEPYRGFRTWIAFQRKIEGLASLDQLTKAIVECQPELLGYVSMSGQNQKIQDAVSLVACWCRAAEKYLVDGTPTERAIETVLDELHTLLGLGLVTQQVRMPLRAYPNNG